jgi:hypothetical protein
MARGFFRLWIVVSVIWIVSASILLDARQPISDALAAIPQQPSFPRAPVKANSSSSDKMIATIDEALAAGDPGPPNTIHGMSFNEFFEGGGPHTPSTNWFLWDESMRKHEAAMDELPMIGLTLVSLPLLSLVLGLAVAWIFRGFVPRRRGASQNRF